MRTVDKYHLESGILPSTPNEREQLRKKIVSSYKDTNIPGKKIYHGTDKSQIECILKGPKETRAGWGGPGLNVTTYPEVAEIYVKAAGSIRRNHRGVKMYGFFNPDLNMNYRVTQIKTVGYYHGGPVELSTCHFPVDWARHYDILKFIKQNSDIVYNITPVTELGDFYVVRESAGRKVIIWEGYYPYLAPDRVNPNVSSLLPKNIHPYFPNEVPCKLKSFDSTYLPNLDCRLRLKIPVASPDRVLFNPVAFW